MSKNATSSEMTKTDIEQPQADESGFVAQYLRDNPSFLIEQPDLLLELELILKEAGAVSLTQIQTQQYRERIQQQQSKLDNLLVNARKNEAIYKAYADLNMHVAHCRDIESLLGELNKVLIDELAFEELKLVLFKHPNASNVELSEIQHRSIFDKKLAKTDFYFGRLGKAEREALFPDAKAESVAMIKLGDEETLGLLAVASTNPLHFTPDMDTMLIDLVRKNLNLLIPTL